MFASDSISKRGLPNAYPTYTCIHTYSYWSGPFCLDLKFIIVVQCIESAG